MSSADGAHDPCLSKRKKFHQSKHRLPTAVTPPPPTDSRPPSLHHHRHLPMHDRRRTTTIPTSTATVTTSAFVDRVRVLFFFFVISVQCYFFLSFYYRAITHPNNTEVTDCQRRSSPTGWLFAASLTREFRINPYISHILTFTYLNLVPSPLVHTYWLCSNVQVYECTSVFHWFVCDRHKNIATLCPIRVSSLVHSA